MTKYLHTMIRVSSLEDSIAFFGVLGLDEIRRRPDEKGRTPTCSSPPPATERLRWNSPTTGISRALHRGPQLPTRRGYTPALPADPDR